MYELPVLSQELFDSLLPFSFITDDQGLILLAGVSFTALHRSTVIGKRFTELVTTASLIEELMPPGLKSLVGETIRLRISTNPGITLCGHVVEAVREEPLYIFSLHPSITSITQLTNLGFTIADFDPGTPLIDLLMLVHIHEVTQNQLRAANKQLATDATMAKLLQTITTTAFCTDNIEKLCQVAVETVCRNLPWDIGHVFFVSPQEPPCLTNSEVWFLSDEQKYKAFVDCTRITAWNSANEFPAESLHSTTPLFLSDFTKDNKSARAASLSLNRQISAVSVSIHTSEKTVAVLEFITENSEPLPDTALTFFSLLARQLGLALDHHMAARKEREHLMQLVSASKMATLGELAAGVAHEIKNPLSTVSLITRIVHKLSASANCSADKLREQTERLELCVERIAEIVRKLSDFSRDSAQDPFSAIALQTILNDVHGLTQARFNLRGISFQVVPCPEDWILECRPSQVSQVLLNLLNNSFDAVASCAERWVTLECQDGGDTFIFAVCDSGPGVDEEYRGKIMTPFFTTKPLGIGVGLGLSISYHIATQHGGTLRLDTSSQRTRFVLELPKRQPKSDATV